MNRLNRELRAEAVGYGLCNQWQGDWLADKSEQELIDMYKRGFDFCIENNYPSITYIKNNFSKDLLHHNLIFVDEDVSEFYCRNGTYILNGACSGKMEFKGFVGAMVYVRHTSDVYINVKQVSRVFVRVYDKAKVHITRAGMAKVHVYRYSKNTTVDADSDIQVKDRFNS